MSFIFDQVPYFKCRVRAEYLYNLEVRSGVYIDAIAVAVRCKRGMSLYFQCWLQSPGYAGIMFLVPIEALTHGDYPTAASTPFYQPWDTFSETFGVSCIDLFQHQRVYVLGPGSNRWEGQYLFTIDFTGNDLADDLEQHKHLHVVKLDCGIFGAYPNNRLLVEDTAFFPSVVSDVPRLKSLAHESRAEGPYAVPQSSFPHPVAEPVQRVDEAAGAARVTRPKRRGRRVAASRARRVRVSKVRKNNR